jgi:transformation/transcription domain-associated protein
MLIVHNLASAIIHFAKVARKHRLYPVCLVSLSKIHSIPSVPVLDCFQKIKEQVSMGQWVGVVHYDSLIFGLLSVCLASLNINI